MKSVREPCRIPSVVIVEMRHTCQRDQALEAPHSRQVILRPGFTKTINCNSRRNPDLPLQRLRNQKRTGLWP